jgi:hypothetical protein
LNGTRDRVFKPTFAVAIDVRRSAGKDTEVGNDENMLGLGTWRLERANFLAGFYTGLENAL